MGLDKIVFKEFSEEEKRRLIELVDSSNTEVFMVGHLLSIDDGVNCESED